MAWRVRERWMLVILLFLEKPEVPEGRAAHRKVRPASAIPLRTDAMMQR